MKEIEVNSYNVPASARSKNYKGSLTSVVGVNSTTAPAASTPTGGSADTAKVAQNLASDSTDWAKIMRKDIDERTENSLSVGKNLGVDGKATISELVATALSAASATIQTLTATAITATSATIIGALTAATVSATTMSATAFIGDLQGNAATATKLKTARTIWGQSFDGSENVEGVLSTRPQAGNYNEGIRLHVSSTGWSTLMFCGADNTGDTGTSENSWSFHNGNGQFMLGHNSTNNVMLIDANNNIGLGTTSPTYKLDVNGNMRVTSDIYADATVGTRNFASHTTGWRADSNGNADFRNIYADELRVQAFTADISQALAGSDYLTKSVSKLSANFVVPAVNSSVRIIVDDIEGMPATQCFTNGDYIRFRAFNRTSGLTIANVWGTVSLDTSFGTGGFLNGTQAYTFTCTATSGAGLTVFKGSEVLDYGTSESGLISRTTLDAMGSPYEQIATWQGDPSNANNYTVHARLGNLNGIANCNGYGVYTDNGFFTGKITVGDLTKSNHYLDFSNGKLTVQGDIRLASGYSAVSTFDMSNGISLAVNNIKVGSRNLLTDTKTFENYINIQLWTRTNDYQGLHVFYSNAQWMGLAQYYNIIAGVTYTFSANVYGDSASSIYIFATKPDNTQIQGIQSKSFGSITSWTRIGITFTPTESATLYIRVENGSENSNLNVCGYKLVEGNKDDGWSPAPEDVDASINLKVSKDGVIGAINLTSEAATISASKINLVGAVTADSLTAHCVTSDKVNMTEFTASTGFVDAFNANVVTANRLNAAAILTNALTSNTITANNATITNLKMTNATVSGTLVGVSGTFSYLQAVGSNGRLIFNNAYGRITIEDEDFGQQGTKNNRSLRLYASNIRCRGSFGASSMNMARVNGEYIRYYVNGDLNTYVTMILQSNGVGGYYIPLYPTSNTGYLSGNGATFEDLTGFPVDLLVFDNSSDIHYELDPFSCGKKVTLVNAHDGSVTVFLAINGNLNWPLYGGMTQQLVNIRELTNPLISSSVHGAGWMLLGGVDNNWK